MSYSVDLRERVIKFIEEGASKSYAARTFRVSRPAIDRWIRKKETNGTLEDLPLKRGWKKIDPQALISYVQEFPDLTLADYAKHFKASGPSIWLAFKRLKITRKKRQNGIKSGMNKNAPYFWKKSPLIQKSPSFILTKVE